MAFGFKLTPSNIFKISAGVAVAAFYFVSLPQYRLKKKREVAEEEASYLASRSNWQQPRVNKNADEGVNSR